MLAFFSWRKIMVIVRSNDFSGKSLKSITSSQLAGSIELIFICSFISHSFRMVYSPLHSFSLTYHRQSKNPHLNISIEALCKMCSPLLCSVLLSVHISVSESISNGRSCIWKSTQRGGRVFLSALGAVVKSSSNWLWRLKGAQAQEDRRVSTQ